MHFSSFMLIETLQECVHLYSVLRIPIVIIQIVEKHLKRWIAANQVVLGNPKSLEVRWFSLKGNHHIRILAFSPFLSRHRWPGWATDNYTLVVTHQRCAIARSDTIRHFHTNKVTAILGNIVLRDPLSRFWLERIPLVSFFNTAINIVATRPVLFVILRNESPLSSIQVVRRRSNFKCSWMISFPLHIKV